MRCRRDLAARTAHPRRLARASHAFIEAPGTDERATGAAAPARVRLGAGVAVAPADVPGLTISGATPMHTMQMP